MTNSLANFVCLYSTRAGRENLVEAGSRHKSIVIVSKSESEIRIHTATVVDIITGAGTMTMVSNRTTMLAIAAVALVHSLPISAFHAPAFHSTILPSPSLNYPLVHFAAAASSDDSTSSSSSPSPKRVAVAGATGRTGKYVVSELLSRDIPVLALVRDVTKAKNVLDPTNELLTIRQTDLGNREDVLSALSSTTTTSNYDDNNNNNIKCDAAIWCATGFSDAPDQTIFTKLKAIFGLATNAKGTIDAVGLPALGEGLANSPKRQCNSSNSNGSDGVLPKVVMLSSAGCTRPDWSEEKKLALEGCAGIPIVR